MTRTRQDLIDALHRLDGSGYGGAITAARLGIANATAGKGLSIAVLERGDEHPTGTFPEVLFRSTSKIPSGFNDE